MSIDLGQLHPYEVHGGIFIKKIIVGGKEDASIERRYQVYPAKQKNIDAVTSLQHESYPEKGTEGVLTADKPLLLFNKTGKFTAFTRPRYQLQASS